MINFEKRIARIRKFAVLSFVLSVVNVVLQFTLLAMLLTSCRAGAEPTHPVAIVAWPSPNKPSCDLPPVPPPYVLVGYPNEGRIYMTVSDLAGLTMYEASLNAWAQQVALCMSKMARSEP